MDHQKNQSEELDYELRKAEGLPIPAQEAEDLGKPIIESIVPAPPIGVVGAVSQSSGGGETASPLTNGLKSGVPDSSFVPNANVTSPYARPSSAGTSAGQRASVQGQPCVDCGVVSPTQVADHIDPLVVQYYRDGAVDVPAQRSLGAVQPHCQPRWAAQRF